MFLRIHIHLNKLGLIPEAGYMLSDHNNRTQCKLSYINACVSIISYGECCSAAPFSCLAKKYSTFLSTGLYVTTRLFAFCHTAPDAKSGGIGSLH